MVIQRKKKFVHPDRVYLGKIVKSHGLQGEIRLKPFGCPPELFDALERMYCDSDRPPLKIQSWRGTPDSPILKLIDINDRNAADALVGEVLWVHETDLPELEEGYFYVSDLIYATAETEEGAVLGKIEEVIETGGADVMVIRGSGCEILLPVNAEYLRNVIKEEKRVIVKLMEYEDDNNHP